MIVYCIACVIGLTYISEDVVCVVVRFRCLEISMGHAIRIGGLGHGVRLFDQADVLSPVSTECIFFIDMLATCEL